MKAFLLYADQDFDGTRALPWPAAALIQDLELDLLFDTMADGDSFVRDVVVKAVLAPVVDPATIRYRQQILDDCLKNPRLVRAIYDLAVETIEAERLNFWGLLREHPSAILNRSRDVLAMFVLMLRKLRDLAAAHQRDVTSAGLTTLFAMLQRELSDAYFAEVDRHLRHLQFPHGLVISAALGDGNKGCDYVLHQPPDHGPGWRAQLFGAPAAAYTFCIAERDESGTQALVALKNQGLNLVANALAQSVDHILSFFQMLRTELAFYLGAVNLAHRLAEIGAPRCFPQPGAAGERAQAFTDLYDAALALRVGHRVVGNTVRADGKDLVIITGANQGGKSTFLRSIGVAQLLMQCGMFAPAESFCAPVCAGLYTHYKREEDATMRSGKLDEELSRMSAIADHLQPNALVLFNESFAATNEREGSEIARQIVCALRERGIRVFFVTHLYELAHGFYDQLLPSALFLRAPRHTTGERPFTLVEGEPLRTSYGEDVYAQVFGNESPRPQDGDGNVAS